MKAVTTLAGMHANLFGYFGVELLIRLPVLQIFIK